MKINYALSERKVVRCNFFSLLNNRNKNNSVPAAIFLGKKQVYSKLYAITEPQYILLPSREMFITYTK
jgi:hypothetical protein